MPGAEANELPHGRLHLPAGRERAFAPLWTPATISGLSTKFAEEFRQYARPFAVSARTFVRFRTLVAYGASGVGVAGARDLGIDRHRMESGCIFPTAACARP